jgi:hypothetical protein
MARYTCSYVVKVGLDQLKPLLSEILQSCRFEVIYHTMDYMMAKEIPGEISFSKLVTVEILIDNTTAKKNEVQVNLVVKNDELPLQLDNHCSQLFNRIKELLSKHQQWELVGNVSS